MSTKIEKFFVVLMIPNLMKINTTSAPKCIHGRRKPLALSLISSVLFSKQVHAVDLD